MTAMCDVHLHRREVTEPWGFSMVGGREQHKPLFVSKVRRGGPAEGQLEEGEEIIKIDETWTTNLYHHHAVGLMKNTGLYLKLTINRSSMSTMSSVPVWRPVKAPTQNLLQDRVQREPPAFLQQRLQDIKTPVNVPQLHTISHHKPSAASSQRPISPVYQFPALPPESSSLKAPVPSPRATSPAPTNNQSVPSYRRVMPYASSPLIGQPLPLTVFYSTPDVAFVGNPTASTRTVDVNLPLGSTIRGVSTVFPFRTPPRIDRPKKDEHGPCIMMRM